jgi:hypothetical protein
MSKHVAKIPKLQGDNENIWTIALDTFEEGQHDVKSSLMGDDSDHGDLIGATHTQVQMLANVFYAKTKSI